MSITVVHAATMLGKVHLPAAANIATLVALKADAVYGDAGTGAPNNGASANDPAWGTGEYVRLTDGSKARWNGTAWVAGT